jgi:hypothetical protein
MKYKIIKILIILIGIIIGIYQFLNALKTIFTFTDSVLFTEKVFIYTGPFLTLPLVLLSIYSLRLGVVLIICSIISLISIIISYNIKDIIYFTLTCSLPMFLIGISMLTFKHWENKESNL